MLSAKPVPRVLSRHNLLMGGERTLVLLSAVSLGGIAASSMNVPAFVVCGSLWIALLWAFRKMAKHDPQFSEVYQRGLNYKGYYPPASRPYRTR
jgi:type IV secretion system protein VirB3